MSDVVILNLGNNFKLYFRDLHTWIQNSIWPRGFFEIVKVIDVIFPDKNLGKSESKCFFAISTSTYLYRFIAVKPWKDEREGSITGDVSPKIPPNKNMASGTNDLSGGGVYSEETWLNLLQGIIKYEVVPFPPF